MIDAIESTITIQMITMMIMLVQITANTVIRSSSMDSMTESQLQEAVAHYIRIRYPDVLFHSDFGSGTKLTLAQAMRQKRQNGGRRAWPDIFIAEPKPNFCQDGYSSCGLFLELKKGGTRLKKKNGEWANEHIAEQAKVLTELRSCGYRAEFAVGFDETTKLIDDYLGD